MSPHKNLYFLILLCSFASLVWAGCSAIIEPSIADKTVIAEAPGNQYQSASYAISFWWDQVDNALSYRLQVVTPNFNTIGALVLDTVVKSNKFTINLSPGTYQWRVLAQNGSSHTAYSDTKGFTILQSSIKQQSVQLTSPANSTLTNLGSVSLQWGGLYGATKYQLEIDTNNFINENALVYNQTLPGGQINFTFPKDGTYQWRVRAENDTAQAQWSAINTITYDHTPPAQVVLTAPANGLSVTQPVSLQWGSVPSAVKYRLYAFKGDSTTVYNTTFPATVTTAGYNFSGVSGDHVYWKVSAIDAAGNEGKTSLLRSFVVQ